MTRYVVRIATLALLACSTPLAAQRAARRVIDAAGIAAAGWHRVGDVVSALPPGATASVDGFNHSLTSSRVGFTEASGSSASWMVRLDGQVMPVSVGGLWILDAIPVAMTQVDSVVITDGPAIVDGRSVVLGTIELYTRRARKGLSAIADYQHGDETGDPGPYRYTSRTSPNVEKLGPFAAGAAAFGTRHAVLDVAARYASLNTTDTRIISRFPGMFESLQSVTTYGGSGVLTMDAFGGRHYMVGGRGRSTGLMHIPLSGIDQLGRVITTHGGMSGAMRARTLPLRYGISATRLEMANHGAVLRFVTEQDRLIGDAFVEASPAAGRLHVGAGVNVGRQDLATATNERRTGRAWVGYSGSSETATLALERALGRMRVAGTFRHERQVADSESVAITATAMNSWIDADNAWLDGFGTATTHGRATGLGDLRLEMTTRRLARLKPTWYGRGFVFSSLTGTGDQFGIAAGVVATTELSTRTRAWIRGEISQAIGSPQAGETSMPGGFIEANASAMAPGRFFVAVSGRYAPATTWPVPSSGGPTDVPATRRVDFSMNKSLWRERVRAQLVMRNILNVAERTHPEGAQWNFRTHLAVTIALPPIPEQVSR